MRFFFFGGGEAPPPRASVAQVLPLFPQDGQSLEVSKPNRLDQVLDLARIDCALDWESFFSSVSPCSRLRCGLKMFAADSRPRRASHCGHDP